MDIRVENRKGGTYEFRYTFVECVGQKIVTFSKENEEDDWYNISQDVNNNRLTVDVYENETPSERNGVINSFVNGNKCQTMNVWQTHGCNCTNVELGNFIDIPNNGIPADSVIGKVIITDDCVEKVSINCSTLNLGLNSSNGDIYVTQDVGRNTGQTPIHHTIYIHMSNVYLPCKVKEIVQEGTSYICNCNDMVFSIDVIPQTGLSANSIIGTLENYCSITNIKLTNDNTGDIYYAEESDGNVYLINEIPFNNEPEIFQFTITYEINGSNCEYVIAQEGTGVDCSCDSMEIFLTPLKLDFPLTGSQRTMIASADTFGCGEISARTLSDILENGEVETERSDDGHKFYFYTTVLPGPYSAATVNLYFRRKKRTDFDQCSKFINITRRPIAEVECSMLEFVSAPGSLITNFDGCYGIIGETCEHTYNGKAEILSSNGKSGETREIRIKVNKNDLTNTDYEKEDVVSKINISVDCNSDWVYVNNFRFDSIFSGKTSGEKYYMVVYKIDVEYLKNTGQYARVEEITYTIKVNNDENCITENCALYQLALDENISCCSLINTVTALSRQHKIKDVTLSASANNTDVYTFSGFEIYENKSVSFSSTTCSFCFTLPRSGITANYCELYEYYFERECPSHGQTPECIYHLCEGWHTVWDENITGATIEDNENGGFCINLEFTKNTDTVHLKTMALKNVYICNEEGDTCFKLGTLQVTQGRAIEDAIDYTKCGEGGLDDLISVASYVSYNDIFVNESEIGSNTVTKENVEVAYMTSKGRDAANIGGKINYVNYTVKCYYDSSYTQEATNIQVINVKPNNYGYLVGTVIINNFSELYNDAYCNGLHSCYRGKFLYFKITAIDSTGLIDGVYCVYEDVAVRQVSLLMYDEECCQSTSYTCNSYVLNFSNHDSTVTATCENISNAENVLLGNINIISDQDMITAFTISYGLQGDGYVEGCETDFSTGKVYAKISANAKNILPKDEHGITIGATTAITLGKRLHKKDGTVSDCDENYTVYLHLNSGCQF